MSETRIAAEAFHPAELIKEELEAREWSISDLAKRMPGDFGINHVALEFYLDIGPETPSLRMGPQAVDISRAFGTDPDFFSNLERSYLDHPTTKAKLAKDPH